MIIQTIESEDWTAVYIDGVKVDEGHYFHGTDLMRILQQRGVITIGKCIEVGLENELDIDPSPAFPNTLPDDLSTIPGYID
jgi:hypothetical protein